MYATDADCGGANTAIFSAGEEFWLGDLVECDWSMYWG